MEISEYAGVTCHHKRSKKNCKK